MSEKELKTIVPPPELCKLIPEGKSVEGAIDTHEQCLIQGISEKSGSVFCEFCAKQEKQPVKHPERCVDCGSIDFNKARWSDGNDNYIEIRCKSCGKLIHFHWEGIS